MIGNSYEYNNYLKHSCPLVFGSFFTVDYCMRYKKDPNYIVCKISNHPYREFMSLDTLKVMIDSKVIVEIKNNE